MSMNVNSPLVDREIIQDALLTAMSNGGEWAEVFVEDRQSGAAEYDENRVETMVSSRDLGAGIRVTVGDATGFAHTSDISTSGLRSRPSCRCGSSRRRKDHTDRSSGNGTAESKVQILPESVPKARKS